LLNALSLGRAVSFAGTDDKHKTLRYYCHSFISPFLQSQIKMKAFSLDNLLVLLRGTILHPFTSLVLPVGLVILGKEPNPIELGSDLASTKWLGLSPNMRWAAGCVIAAWTLTINRTLSRSALNPSRKPRPDMRKEVVVVTGAAGGVGAALVRKLEAVGATVIVLDISPLSYTPGRGTSYIKCDISDPNSVRDAAAKVVSRHGVPTALVANAGVVRGRTLLDASDHDLSLTFGVNVMGLVWTFRAFLPDMIAAGRGHVLATLSATAFVTVSGMADYSASKAAAASLIEGLRTELKHHHGNPAVAVSAVYPATISTNMFKDLESPDLFAMPILSPDDVAQRMFDILSSGQRYFHLPYLHTKFNPVIFADAVAILQPKRVSTSGCYCTAVAPRPAKLDACCRARWRRARCGQDGKEEVVTSVSLQSGALSLLFSPGNHCPPAVSCIISLVSVKKPSASAHYRPSCYLQPR
jgi:short-subunit dehydrogenase